MVDFVFWLPGMLGVKFVVWPNKVATLSLRRKKNTSLGHESDGMCRVRIDILCRLNASVEKINVAGWILEELVKHPSRVAEDIHHEVTSRQQISIPLPAFAGKEMVSQKQVSIDMV